MDNQHELLLKARQGDIKAFHKIFSDFQEPLKSYLYRLTTDRNDTEDLSQDTFVRAFDKLNTFQGKSTLKTWVFRIATNLALDMLRKRKRWPVDAQDQSRAASQVAPEIVQAYLTVNRLSPHGTYEIREHIDFCFTCLSKTLPLEQQVALILKDIYGFKIKQIELILNRSVSKIKHLLHDARKKMADIFDDRCALINKNGVCHQCTELNGLFNPKQQAQEEIMKLEMVNIAKKEGKQTLLKLRVELIKGIDPLNAVGTDLHESIMQRVRTVIGETN